MTCTTACEMMFYSDVTVWISTASTDHQHLLPLHCLFSPAHQLYIDVCLAQLPVSTSLCLGPPTVSTGVLDLKRRRAE